MSAFAAFKPKLKNDEAPKAEPLSILQHQMATSSNFTPSLTNTIFRPESISYGLKKGDYLLMKGTYSVKVLSGVVMVNNSHTLTIGADYCIITNSCESLPILSCNQERDTKKSKSPLLSDCDSVIEVSNYENGLADVGNFYSSLEGHYYPKRTLYTFELVTDGNQNLEDIYSVHFDSYVHRHLTRIAKGLSVVVVFGSQMSGKTTIAKALLNHSLSAGKTNVAYLDLDVESSNARIPGCLSLTVHDSPLFGAFLPCNQSISSLNKHCYWGLDSYLEMPERYVQVCKSLIQHYQQNIQNKGIPLVVRYPSFIKGYGHRILIKLTEYLKADQLIYMSHHNATELNGFEADAFEAQDNPDTEVVAEFKKISNVTILRGTRRSFDLSKKELLVRNKLLYFHQTNNGLFDFEPILCKRPLSLSFDYILAFSVIDYTIDDESLYDRLHCLVEATIMGIFAHKQHIEPNKSLFINGEDFFSLDPQFLCLSMVHSVDYNNRQINVYLPQDDNVHQAIQNTIEDGNKLLFARGEGKIPIVDMIPPEAKGVFLPYVESSAKNKIGGIWKPRKAISRRNHGK